MSPTDKENTAADITNVVIPAIFVNLTRPSLGHLVLVDTFGCFPVTHLVRPTLELITNRAGGDLQK